MTGSDAPSSPTPFTHAVASFDPTADGVLLWTRAVGVDRLRWTVTTGHGTRVVACGHARPDPSSDWCVTLAVGGLEPATTYRYDFAAPDGRRSPVGRTRTLPAGPERHGPYERWSLVATAVTFSPLQLPIAPEDVTALDSAMPSGNAVVDGKGLCTDEWDGYPVERDRLVRAMRERDGGVVLLSGDVHSAWALEVRDPSDALPVAAEVVCPSLTATPMGRHLPRGTEHSADVAVAAMPHRRWSDLQANGWLRISVTAERTRADWFEVPCDTTAAEDRAPGHPGEPLASWEITPTMPVAMRTADAPLPGWADRGGMGQDRLPPRPEAPRRRWPAWTRVTIAGLAAAAATAAVAVWRRRYSPSPMSRS